MIHTHFHVNTVLNKSTWRIREPSNKSALLRVSERIRQSSIAAPRGFRHLSRCTSLVSYRVPSHFNWTLPLHTSNTLYQQPTKLLPPVLGSHTYKQYNISSSSSIGTTAHCGLWPVEQCPSIFFLSATNSLHLLTPSTWRSLSTSSFHPFLCISLLLVPSSSWVKIFFGILSSSILSRWPNQFILCPFIHFTIFSPLLVPSSSRFVRLFHSPLVKYLSNKNYSILILIRIKNRDFWIKRLVNFHQKPITTNKVWMRNKELPTTSK